MDKLKIIYNKPEYLFLFFAIILGVVLVFILPPLGGNIDECYHFQRIISIAYFHVLNDQVLVPNGLIKFIKEGVSFFNPDARSPFGFSWSEWHKMATIPLDAGNLQILQPNTATYNNPFGYLPQAITMRIGLLFELSPLVLFYLARLAGLFASIFLTFLAIRKIPSHKYALCALALLPSIYSIESHLIANGITNSLAFLFIACSLRETYDDGIIKSKTIVKLAIIGIILAQCKIVYVCLLFLVLAIPKKRFSSNLSRWVSYGIIIIPSAILSLIYLIIIKKTSFAGISYHTWGGEVNPDAQVAFILSHPIEYITIFLRTIFTTSFVITSVISIFSSVAIFDMPPFALITILYLFILAVIADISTSKTLYYGKLGLLISAIISSFGLISLTLLYIQWTGVALPIIKGFQGSYLIPFLPLLLLAFPALDKPIFSVKPQIWIIFLAIFGFIMSVWEIKEGYYG